VIVTANAFVNATEFLVLCYRKAWWTVHISWLPSCHVRVHFPANCQP